MVIPFITKVLSVLLVFYTIFIFQALGFFSVYGFQINVFLLVMVLATFLVSFETYSVAAFLAVCGGLVLFVLYFFPFWIISFGVLAVLCFGILFTQRIRTGSHALDFTVLLAVVLVLFYGVMAFVGDGVFSSGGIVLAFFLHMFFGLLVWYVFHVLDLTLPAYV